MGGLYATAGCNLGLLELERGGDPDRAQLLFAEALTIARERGLLNFICMALDGYAELAAARGQARRGLCLAGAVAALSAPIGMRVRVDWDPPLEGHLKLARGTLSAEAQEVAWADGYS